MVALLALLGYRAACGIARSGSARSTPLALSLSRVAGSRIPLCVCLNLRHFLLFLDRASLDLSEDLLGESEELGAHAFVVAILVQAPFGNLDGFLGMKQAIFAALCEDLSYD